MWVIFSSILIPLIMMRTSFGGDSVWSVDDSYGGLEKQLLTAPLSFLPVCKPEKVHIFSQKQIRCACGIRCRYLCEDTKPTIAKKSKSGEQKCKRSCVQRPCYRPAEYLVYSYILADGVCQRKEVCSYQAKCIGEVRKGVKYSLDKCHTFRQSTRYYRQPRWDGMYLI